MIHSDTHTSTCTTSYADVPVATDDDATDDDVAATDYVDDATVDDDAAVMMMLLLIVMMMLMKNALFAERECCFDSFMKTFLDC